MTPFTPFDMLSTTSGLTEDRFDITGVIVVIGLYVVAVIDHWDNDIFVFNNGEDRTIHVDSLLGSSVEFVAINGYTLMNNKTVSDKEVARREVFCQSAAFARFVDDGVLQSRAVVYRDKSSHATFSASSCVMTTYSTQRCRALDVLTRHDISIVSVAFTKTLDV